MFFATLLVGFSWLPSIWCVDGGRIPFWSGALCSFSLWSMVNAWGDGCGVREFPPLWRFLALASEPGELGGDSFIAPCIIVEFVLITSPAGGCCCSKPNLRPPAVGTLPYGMSGVLEVDGSSRYFFIIVTFTTGDEVLALPVDDGAGVSFTMADCDCVVVVVEVVCELFVLECTLGGGGPLPIGRLPAPILSSLLFNFTLLLLLALFDLWVRALLAVTVTLLLLEWFVRVDDDSAAVRFLPFLPSFDCDLNYKRIAVFVWDIGAYKVIKNTRFNSRLATTKENVCLISRQKRTSHTQNSYLAIWWEIINKGNDSKCDELGLWFDIEEKERKSESVNWWRWSAWLVKNSTPLS